MKFNGKFRSGMTRDFYSVMLNDRYFPLCYGTMYKYVGLPDLTCESFGTHHFAWGYDGEGPQLLGATMLAVAMGIDFDPEQFLIRGDSVPIASVSHLVSDINGKSCNGKGYLDHKPPPYCANIPLKVKGLYKNFTSEVIANFSDTWELTTDEILQWIKSKEKQCS